MTNAILSAIIDKNGIPKPPTKIDPITCTLEVVTPMFLGGADSKNQDIQKHFTEGLRATSVKGVLRSWWRLAQSGSVQDLILAEQEIWGTLPTPQNNHPPRGPIIRTYPLYEKTKCLATACAPIAKGPGSAEFYLGYGAVRNQNKPEENPGKTYWAKQSQFSLIVEPTSQIQEKSLKDALSLWHGFGGLGSRCRRTWGSVIIKNQSIHKSPDDLLGDLQSLIPIGKAPKDRPSLFEARMAVAPIIFDNLDQIHQKLFVLFKGEGKTPGLHKRCWAFGLPWSGRNAQPSVPRLPKDQDRRASPLILKIHPLVKGYALVALKLSGPFHPCADPGPEQIRCLDDFLNEVSKIRK